VSPGRSALAHQHGALDPRVVPLVIRAIEFCDPKGTVVFDDICFLKRRNPVNQSAFKAHPLRYL
jgi:hypothetical protein